MSWWQLVSIKREATQYVEYEKTQPPLACPYDGEPLKETPRGGGLYCPLGNYEWPRTPRLI